MPYRPCIEPGCPTLTSKTRCAAHERERQQVRGHRGMDAEYRRHRLIVLAASDICWRCHKPGATTADHVIPRAHGGSNDLSNLRPACARCNYSAGATVRKNRP